MDPVLRRALDYARRAQWADYNNNENNKHEKSNDRLTQGVERVVDIEGWKIWS